jgi:hypothetical protein
MSLHWIKKNNKPGGDIIVFVHGFTGDGDTFLNINRQHLFALIDPNYTQSCDCCEFRYTSRLLPFDSVRKLLPLIPIFGKRMPYRKTAHLNACAKMLRSE